MYFLSQCIRQDPELDKEMTVIYAGAAAGNHIMTLSKLFPRANFILWDPSNFYSGLRKNPKIEINQDFFTDEVAKTYAEKKMCIYE